MCVYYSAYEEDSDKELEGKCINLKYGIVMCVCIFLRCMHPIPIPTLLSLCLTVNWEGVLKPQFFSLNLIDTARHSGIHCNL